MAGNWYCLYFNYKIMKYKDIHARINKELDNVFGKDLEEFVLFGERLTDNDFSKEVDNYVFVKCSNYSNYVKNIEKSCVILGALDNIQSPLIISEEEIKTFKSNMKTNYEEVKLYKGDEVKIKEGIYSNLIGIVNKEMPNNSYEITFKLKTTILKSTIYRSNLVKIKNIFDKLKFPVLEGNKCKKL